MMRRELGASTVYVHTYIETSVPGIVVCSRVSRRTTLSAEVRFYLVDINIFYLFLLIHYSHATYLDHGDTHSPFPSTAFSARCGSPLPSALA
jgi:hypothetical protein